MRTWTKRGLFPLATILLTAAALGDPSLKWYASRSAVVCTDAPTQGARLRIHDVHGHVAFEGKVKGPRAVIEVGRPGRTLPNGTYQAQLVHNQSVICSHDFIHTNYPWFNTSVGKADILLPGFTPLKATSREIEAVGRKYVFARSGLPREVWTLGEQILARPVELKMKTSAPSQGTLFKIQKTTNTKVSFRGEWCRGRVEQDGLIVFDVALPETEGPVTVEIPVKKEYARFFHICGDAIRSNPAGTIPSGVGRVFGSRSMGGCGMTLDNFMPYCWIGTDDRGICFAADTDRGWVHGKERDAVEIWREKDGTVVLKLNLIAEARRHPARQIELALQASPEKPMPKDWRG